MTKPKGKYHCIIVAVSHKEFIKMHINDIYSLMHENALIVDIKGIWNKRISLKHDNYWCL